MEGERHGSQASNGIVGEQRYQRSDSEGNEEDTDGSSQTLYSGGKKKLRFAVRTVMGGILFLLVLTCVTFSKLILIELADNMRHHTLGMSNNESYELELEAEEDDKKVKISRIYWQLLFILILPQCLTFLRSALVGVIGKTRTDYPWPRRNALIAGAVAAFAEVVAMSTFVFSVLCFLTPELALLSMQAVFIVQFIIDVRYLPAKCSSKHPTRQRVPIDGTSYENIDGVESQLLGDVATFETPSKSGFEKWRNNTRNFFWMLLENKPMRVVALLLQIFGIVGLICFIILERKDSDKKDYLPPVIGLPLSLAVLSFIWSNKVQEFLIAAEKGSTVITANARYKANFLNSFYRICLYPLLGYGIFRLIHYSRGHDINPWILHHFLGTEENSSLFLAQIFTSFAGYIFAWIACVMTLRTVGFAFPLLCSTPIAIVVALSTKDFFLPSFSNEHYTREDNLHYAAPCIWFVIYLGQVLGMGYFICTKNNLIMSQDKDMFLNPHYDGVFLEQYLTLNRQVDKYYMGFVPFTVDGQVTLPRAIFICSTMYHENVREMRQMLKSIKRIAEWYAAQERGLKNLIESHIFFDGAVSGGQLTQYALQLLSLVQQCLGVSVTMCIRKDEPYGQSMSWDIGERRMKFTVHFKDNFKVKNKKRWSQVMYMNYVIKHRIPQSQSAEDEDDRLNEDNTFILTTDADIDFTAESAMVLLDSLASDKEVGAVCARTHPKGSGAMYWYQVFDYAVGHWFLKPAEHLFGSVLCCPGCFSVFRCKALASVLDQYSSEVEGAADFLTKDMGEDRWLCTLLIQKGWRLDYCAISEDYTYCPESFDEFYKQRRRWVPSTMANLLLLMSKAGKITNANNSVSTLFVIFQAIMAFSTAISPATVILIIGSGLQGAYQISDPQVLATIVILGIISVLYGIICLYTSQKTQIDLAKVLTFIFAIIMAVVMVGLFKQIIFEIFPVGDDARSLDPPICRNTTDPYSDCMIARNNLESFANSSSSSSLVHLPTSPTTWYVALFAFTFTVAAILHPKEWTCLIHCIWYLLALPSGYLLLLIYSAANLDSQSWGTRETATASKGGGGGFVMVKKWFRMGLKSFLLCCCRRAHDSAEQRVQLLEEVEEAKSDTQQEVIEVYPNLPKVKHKNMSIEAEEWLRKQDCFEYKSNFEEHGYWSLTYIASMKKEDFKTIGIKQQGFILRLEKAAKKLPQMVIETKVPDTVTQWLKTLEMDEYTKVFHKVGYEGNADVENLKELNDKELMKMGISKMAHVNRLKQAVGSLFHPTTVEVQIYEAKRDVNQIEAPFVEDEEAKFWRAILAKELKPVTVRLQQTSKEIGQKLKTLRNATLALILLVNILWIILLYTVTFPQLKKYDLPERAFQLLFLGVYGIIILVSFFSMLAHRFLMLMQFLGRPEVVSEAINPEPMPWTVLSTIVPR